jgi:signal transduction histidine kinase
MGLTILRDLAESAGGALNVRSAPGAGTTLELEVPAK